MIQYIWYIYIYLDLYIDLLRVIPKKERVMIKSLKSGSGLQRVAAILLGIAALIYAIYHIANLFGEEITTIASGMTTETTVVDTTGYIFRDEKLLVSENAGVANYTVEDGARVSVGDEVARVHKSGSASSKSLLKILDKRIALLEKSTESGRVLADLPDVNDDIMDSYYSLARMLAEGETGGIAKQADKLLIAMNEYSLLTDESSSVKDTLSTMKKQRDGILQSGGSSVVEKTGESGYFYSYADGLEETFTLAAADAMTEQTYYELASMRAPKLSQNVYGKLSDSSEWRFVVKVSALERSYFKLEDGETKTYDVRFTENGNTLIPMTLESVIEDERGGGKILVFHADRLPDGFVFNRCQTVSIEVSSISGIYVPRSAVHSSGGYDHVYVLKGSVVSYRRIEIIHEGKDYYLVMDGAPSESRVEYLGTNELIIVEGSNLFDGRILD